MDFEAETQVADDGATAAERGAVIVGAPGERLGRYVLLHRLGAGGMGVVHAAYDPELDRKVALKLVAFGRRSADGSTLGRTRLLREAQAIARLSHPNVVAVYDVGTLGDQVFVAMEFVDGSTLRGWLEHTRRNHDAILSVFLDAARGLQAAHDAGLIHRDFKPDNVMIGRDGRVRVLDFGLARPLLRADARSRAHTEALLASASGEASLDSGAREDAGAAPGGDSTDRAVAHTLLAASSNPAPTPTSAGRSDRNQHPGASASSLDLPLTMTGAVMGTPAYMAPEQHLGRDVDARTDQFAFCVALWEALYGERPFGGESVAALAFQVVEGKLRPPPAGARVGRALHAALVRGLSADPKARFPSMRALADAIDPGRARARRRRAIVATLALGGAVGIASAWWTRPDPVALCRAEGEALVADLSGEPARKRRQAAFVAIDARTGEASAAQASEHVDDWVARWSLARTQLCSLATTPTPSKADTFARRIECSNRQARRARALAEVWRRPDAAIVQQAPLAALALPSPESCDDVERLARAAALPADPVLEYVVQRLEAELDLVHAWVWAGHFDAAADRARSLLDRAAALGYVPIEAALHLTIANIALERSRPADAAIAAERGLSLAIVSGDEALVAEAWLLELRLRTLGTSEFNRAQWALVPASAAIERIGDPPQIRARFEMAAGVVADKLDRSQEGVERFQRALALGESARLGPVFEADVRNNLSTAYKQLGDAPAAIAELERARTLWSDALGTTHPKVGRALVNLARAHAALGDDVRAESELREAIAIFELAHGRNHANVAASLNGLGLLQWEHGDREGALVTYREALAILEGTVGPDHEHTAKILNNLGILLGELQRTDEAVAILQRALEARRKLNGPTSPDVALNYDNLGDATRRGGRLQEAAHWFGESLRHTEAHAHDRSLQAYPLGRLAELALDAGDLDRAEASLSRAEAIVADVGGTTLTKAVVLVARARLRAARREEPGAIEAACVAAEAAVEPLDTDGDELRAHLRALRGG